MQRLTDISKISNVTNLLSILEEKLVIAARYGKRELIIIIVRTDEIRKKILACNENYSLHSEARENLSKENIIVFHDIRNDTGDLLFAALKREGFGSDVTINDIIHIHENNGLLGYSCRFTW